MEDENMCNACLDAGLSRRSLVLEPLGGMAQAQPMAAANTPDAALNLLIEGNARYVANQPRERDFSAGRASRSQGLPACDGSTTGADRSAIGRRLSARTVPQRF
jgi:hypothetical protein